MSFQYDFIDCLNMNKLLVLSVLIVFADIARSQIVAIHNCWHQVCRECSSAALNGPFLDKRCNPNNLVNIGLLDDPRDALPVDVNTDYACLKMTATNPLIQGDSTDVIRGCVSRMNADSVCLQLSQVEQIRSKRDVRCIICYGDKCNGSGVKSVSALAVSLIGVIFRHLLN